MSTPPASATPAAAPAETPAAPAEMRCGGVSNEKPMVADIEAYATQVRPKVEAKLGSAQAIYEPVSYTSQVVAGAKYGIKVRVGENKFIRVHVWSKPWEDFLEVTDVEQL
eukprot:gnl/Hemi2/28549_TR9459_c0_g1_i1.p2 gnl/Hemi2/28549_TR9459_c0_g1~~gnl/Hemi2/28549_TR9459_c0_g1_i1.p2  ORF type:complete len:125 (-),score=49.91 gnl/Hemi2/28549_TR9459_c0_g1_i1:262-591(-)